VRGGRWNSNLHAFEILLRSVQQGAQRGLDVGCGEGETARRLRTRVKSVVGIDPDRASIEQAQAHDDDIDYHVGALGEVDLADASFDIVASVAMLHHVDQVSGLTQLARLVRPGGMLLVVGLARSRSLRDFSRDARDAVAIRLRRSGRRNLSALAEPATGDHRPAFWAVRIPAGRRYR
jgi:2-polyprenyl-3-methyl-5-hydroxy-6-metoxy-1,4-benzoquinol methylase